MKTHSPNAAHETYAVEAMTITRDVASALKDLGQQRSEALCMMHTSQSISEHQATSSSTMAKPTQHLAGGLPSSMQVGRADDNFFII
jgi:hypothetical protein